MRALILGIGLLIFSLSSYAMKKDSLLFRINQLLIQKQAPALIYISSHDCVSCVSYLTQLAQKDCNFLLAADNSAFYDYAEGIGMSIPQDRIVDIPDLVQAIDSQFQHSVAFFQKSGDSALSVSKLNASILNICSNANDISKHTIKLPSDFNATKLKWLAYLYQPKEQQFQFYDTHYNIVYTFDFDSKMRKDFLDINQQVQNNYYKEIENRLGIKDIQFADSIKKMDANYFLKYMGQAKSNLLCFDDGYEMKYINFCYLKSANDTNTSYTISKVALLQKHESQIAPDNHYFMFQSFALNKTNYYVRPYRFNINGNNVSIPYVNINDDGDVSDSSKINIAVFDLSHAHGYLNNPKQVFRTEIEPNNLTNIVFDCNHDSLFIFDNANKIYSVYDISGRKIDASYKQLGIEFVCDVKIVDNELYYLGVTDTKATKLFHLNKGQSITGTEKELLLNNYFDYLRFVGNGIRGYKIDTDNNAIECFSFKL